mgnify:CR=1 FL=1
MFRKRLWISLVTSLFAALMASGVTAYAAEPVYTGEELGDGQDGAQSFTMPVIVNATDHSGGSGGGDNGGGNDDSGEDDDSGQEGGGDSGGNITGNGDAGNAEQTFIVTVTDRFVNLAGEEQLVSVRSIGKYRKGTYLLFSATKAEGYTVSGERLQAVTVEKDTQIVFTYIEKQTESTSAKKNETEQPSEKTAEDEKKEDQEKAGTVSGNETEMEEEDGKDIREDDRRTPIIRRQQELEGEAAEVMEEPDTPEDMSEEKKPFHIPWWIWLIIALLAIGGTITALALTGKLSYLWLLFVSRFFRNSFKGWHGILTQQESRFIDTVHGENGGSGILQELIDRGGTPAEILKQAKESGDMTYLPPGTKISVSWQDGGEYPAVRRIQAEEEAFYVVLQELAGKGEVIATFFNDPAEIEFALNFEL